MREGGGGGGDGDGEGGSSLRELHNCVFDVVVGREGGGGTVFVGRGAWTYAFVGKWVPGGLVGWMVGRMGGGRGLLKGRGNGRDGRDGSWVEGGRNGMNGMV